MAVVKCSPFDVRSYSQKIEQQSSHHTKPRPHALRHIAIFQQGEWPCFPMDYLCVMTCCFGVDDDD